MRTKKIIEINRFDNFDKNSNNISVEKFYNFYPLAELKNSKGIECAKFYKNLTNKTEKELDIDYAGITKIEGLAYFKQYFSNEQYTTHRLVVYGNDKKVYINQMLDDTYDLFWIYNLTFESEPIVLAYKKDDLDSAILASKEKMVIWTTGYSPYTIENVPIITSMCMNDGVLFCTILDPAFKIWYATDLEVENIGNISSYSGYISLEDDLGYARKILTFNEDVYVFRDYGISKISFVRNKGTVSQVYRSNTKIYANTVSVCGNNILFMTKDGLYSFNGVKVTKTTVELLNALSVENEGAVASSLGEKYYLALHLDFNDDKKILVEEECINNVLIIIDTCDFTYEIIRGVDIKSLLPVKTEVFEKMLVTFNNGPVNRIGQISNNSVYMDSNLPKFWSSDNLFGDMTNKMFTRLKVNADIGVKITLKYDNKQREFITKKQGINSFAFKICCKDIKMEISSSSSSAEVKNLALEYYEQT